VTSTEAAPKQRRYNNSRDIRGDLLRSLAQANRKGQGALTVSELQERIGPPTVSTTAVRDNLRGMSSERLGRHGDAAWVERLGRSAIGGQCWGITAEGLRVAESRGYIRPKATTE
jgi:hypothetical protein